MDKLQKYNQKLLAIIGTLALAGFGLLIIIGVIALIADTVRRSGNREIVDNSLTLNQDLNEEQSEGLLKQDITFDKARLIDTLKTIYLIPISQVNVENKTNGNYEEPVLVSGSRGYSYKKASFHKYSGEYNNILLYNQTKATKDFIFDDKVFITTFSNWVIGSTHYLLVTGATKDSNSDSKLNDEDLKGFFVYDIQSKNLLDFNLDGHEFVDFYFLHDTDKLLLRFAVDKNINGEINYLQEPIVIKELDFLNMELKDFISPNKIKELTEIIN